MNPHLFVIFGATGDLTTRRLLPSLHRVLETTPSAILGVAAGEHDNASFRRVAAASGGAGVDGVVVAAAGTQREDGGKRQRGQPQVRIHRHGPILAAGRQLRGIGKTAHMAQPQPGDRAPTFSLPDQDGRQVDLADLGGHWVVLWWFPKASTPG